MAKDMNDEEQEPVQKKIKTNDLAPPAKKRRAAKRIIDRDSDSDDEIVPLRKKKFEHEFPSTRFKKKGVRP